jgi:hypothetical protein
MFFFSVQLRKLYVHAYDACAYLTDKTVYCNVSHSCICACNLICAITKMWGGIVFLI